MGHAGPVVVARGIDEDLRLPLEPPERLRMEDSVAVALERRSQATLLLFVLAQPATRLVRAHGQRREASLFVLADLGLECVRNPSSDLRHATSRLLAPAAVGSTG